MQACLKWQEALWEALRAEAERQASLVIKRLGAHKAADVSELCKRDRQNAPKRADHPQHAISTTSGFTWDCMALIGGLLRLEQTSNP